MMPTFAFGDVYAPKLVHFSYLGKEFKPDVFIETDEPSVLGNYQIEILAHTEDGQAKVNMYLINKETGDESIVFAEQWLENGKMNAGFLEIAKGEWILKVVLEDSDGRKTSYEHTVIVTDKEYSGFEIIEVIPNPIYVTQQEQSAEIKVTIENKLARSRTATVAWRWADETVWRELTEVHFGSIYSPEGKQTITFTIPKELKGDYKRALIVSVNPEIDVPDRKDMEKSVEMIERTVDLEAKHIYLKGISNNQAVVGFVFFHNDKYGSNSDVTTDYRYGVNGTQYGSGNFTLSAGELRTIDDVTLTLPENVHNAVVYSQINPTKTKPSVEYDFDNNMSKLQLNSTKTINLYAKSISGGIYRQGDTILTEVVVGHSEGSITLSGPVLVVLRKDGEEIASREVFLYPGEERSVLFEWVAPKHPDNLIMEVELEAEINPIPRRYEEVTYDDNVVKTRVILIPTFNLELGCPPHGTVNYVVSGKADRVCCPPPDDEGECWVCGPDYYYEGFTVYLTPPSKEKVKAGMGFSFEVKTQYYNEFGRKVYYDEYNPKYGEYEPNKPWDNQAYYPKGNKYDFRRVEAEFPDAGIVEMVPEDSPYTYPTRSNTWYLPRALIQRGQGDLEMIEYLKRLTPIPNLNDETHVDGGNAYYTSFYAPDGEYPYIVYGYEGGVDRIVYYHIPDPKSPGAYIIDSEFSPRLKFCVEDSVTIEGSPHDDYVYRRIDPNNPFPVGGQHGWNWAGQVHTISNIADWWTNYGRGNYNIGQRKMILDLTQDIRLPH